MLVCSDSTIKGRTGELVPVTCNTTCLVAYSVNSFLKGFEGIDFPVCQAVGCANLDEDGQVINDAAKRLGIAASGEILTFTCDNTTFASNPNALQADRASGNPCNWYNPGSMDGDVLQSAQTCTMLEQVGQDTVQGSWAVQNIRLIIGLSIGCVALFTALGCFSCWKRRRERQSGPLIKLNAGKQSSELVGLLSLAYVTIFCLAFMNAMQPFLLQSIYLVESQVFGRVTGLLTLADEVWSFLWLGLWGIASDMVGLRRVVQAGLILTSISLLLFPFANTVFPGVLLVRLVFAQGGAALASMLTVFLADLVHLKSLGLGSGLLGLASGAGALTAVFLFIGPVATSICVTYTYITAACMPFCFFLLTLLPCWTLLPVFTDDETREGEQDQQDISFMLRLRQKAQTVVQLGRQSIHAAVQEPRIATAYIAGYCARAGSVVVTVFISLWVVKFFEQEGACDASSASDKSTCGEGLVNPDKRSCATAFTVTSRISGTVQTVALIFALLAGYSATKLRDPFYGLIAFAAFSVVAYGLTPAFEDPQATSFYAIAILWGIAEISMIVYAQVVVAAEISKRFSSIKGAIAGMFSMCGSLGIIFLTYVGGVLFDVWIPQAPFVLMSVTSALVMVAGLFTLLAERGRDSTVDKNDLI